jgi:hypothetical protein
MLNFPPDPAPYRVVGLDPGTDTMGVATIDVFLGMDQAPVLVEVQTFSGEQLGRAYRHVSEFHGDRVARLVAHEENLLGYFMYLQPHCIISESPFLGRFPQAYAALVTCIEAIRRAVIRYSAYMPLLQVDPPTVKLVVGVKGRGTTKDDVKRGLLQLIAQGRLLNPYQIDIEGLDEHSVDAIVVALSRAEYLLANF